VFLAFADRSLEARSRINENNIPNANEKNLGCIYTYTTVAVPEARFKSWESLQILWDTSWFDRRSYQIFWDVVGLERGPLSFVSTIEELLGRKSSVSSLGSREYGCRDPPRWPRCTISNKLALTSPTSGGRSIGIVSSRTQAMGFRFDTSWFSSVPQANTT
jgi:hypothetical protein